MTLAPDITRRDVTIERLRFGTKRLDTNLAPAIVSAQVEYSLDIAATLRIGLRDYGRAFRDSRTLRRGLRVALRRSDAPGYDRFALVNVSKTGDGLDLTFEAEEVYRLRDKVGIKKANRNQVTRAEFVYSLIREVTHPTIDFYSPDIYTVQPIQFSGRLQRDLGRNSPRTTDDRGRAYGFAPDEQFSIKGRKANDEQRRNLAEMLTACVETRAPKTVIVAAVATVIQENCAYNRVAPECVEGTDLDSVGMFQQRPSQGWTGLRDIRKATRQFLLGKKENNVGGAIAYYARTRTSSIAKIAQYVQGSAHPDAYRKWENESRRIVNLFLGSDRFDYRGDTDRRTKVYTAKYEFMRGNPNNANKLEDSWTCIRRLADEVRWRAFAYRGTIFFLSEKEMSSKTAWAVISEKMDGVFGISYSYEVTNAQQPKKAVREISIEVAAERWSAPPGSVIIIAGEGPLIDKVRWIVASYQQDLFSPRATITLKRPEGPLPEPAPDTASEERDIESGRRVEPIEAETVRGKIVLIAKRELRRAGNPPSGDYIYQMTRPYPTTLQQSVIRTDCSGWTAMVYREAGAPDPSGFNFNGTGFTGTQASHGTPVRRPRPGDLVFYGSLTAGGSSAHVAIVINDKEAIGFGSNGGPRRHSITYRTPVGYRSYVD